MKTKAQILEEFSLFSVPAGGIGNWLTAETDNDVFERLERIDEEPLSAVQLNQLLVLGHEAPASDGFFRYYWLTLPDQHPYRVQELPGFAKEWTQSENILSLEHLKWGFYRLYVDALLYFGNVRSAFRYLRNLSVSELNHFYNSKRFDTEAIVRRGPAIPHKPISKDDRYLISEMACKSYGDTPTDGGDLRNALVSAYKAHTAAGNPTPTIRQLLEHSVPTGMKARQQEFLFSADEVLDESISSEDELKAKYGTIAKKFSEARDAALANTR